MVWHVTLQVCVQTLEAKQLSEPSPCVSYSFFTLHLHKFKSVCGCTIQYSLYSMHLSKGHVTPWKITLQPCWFLTSQHIRPSSSTDHHSACHHQNQQNLVSKMSFCLFEDKDIQQSLHDFHVDSTVPMNTALYQQGPQSFIISTI